MSKLAKLAPVSTWFNVVIPSTGQKNSYRAYNVGDEKALLMAEEDGDVLNMITTIDVVVRNCLKEPVDSLTVYDLEFLFTLIRAKSVGEAVTITLGCDTPGCEEIENQVPIDLTTVYVPGSDPVGSAALIIKQDATRGIKIVHPSVTEATIIDQMKTDRDKSMTVLALCIREVYDGDEIIVMKDEEKSDIIAFVSTLDVSVREKAYEFINSMPQATIDAKYTCRNCKKEHIESIKGIQNFF